MSRLIDSEATEKEMLFWADTYGYGGLTKDNIREILRDDKKTPTVDAVEVIHCGHCRHHENDSSSDSHWCFVWETFTDNHVYCSFAERRQDG